MSIDEVFPTSAAVRSLLASPDSISHSSVESDTLTVDVCLVAVSETCLISFRISETVWNFSMFYLLLIAGYGVCAAGCCNGWDNNECHCYNDSY
jgi:hypothetical protein